jgi:hypothetical protein
MAKKISELTELVDVSAEDFVPVVDASENETKKVTAEHLITGFGDIKNVFIDASETVLESHHKTFRIIGTASDITITVPAGLRSNIEIYYYRLPTSGKVTFDVSTLDGAFGLSDGPEIVEDRAVALRTYSEEDDDFAFFVGDFEDTSS